MTQLCRLKRVAHAPKMNGYAVHQALPYDSRPQALGLKHAPKHAVQCCPISRAHSVAKGIAPSETGKTKSATKSATSIRIQPQWQATETELTCKSKWIGEKVLDQTASGVRVLLRVNGPVCQDVHRRVSDPGE